MALLVTHSRKNLYIFFSVFICSACGIRRTACGRSMCYHWTAVCCSPSRRQHTSSEAFVSRHSIAASCEPFPLLKTGNLLVWPRKYHSYKYYMPYLGYYRTSDYLFLRLTLARCHTQQVRPRIKSSGCTKTSSHRRQGRDPRGVRSLYIIVSFHQRTTIATYLFLYSTLYKFGL